MKISVHTAPTLFESTSTTKTDDSVTVIVNLSSDKEGIDTVAAVRVVFTADEWRALTPRLIETKT